jgi:hypothetical protein
MVTKKEEIRYFLFFVFIYLLNKNIMKKKLFFGWGNIKWFIREINKIYSSQPSFYSKKRIESGIAFIIAQWGMIFFLLEKHKTFTISDFSIWVGIEFFVAGYMVYQIQSEKKKLSNTEPTQEPTEITENNNPQL